MAASSQDTVTELLLNVRDSENRAVDELYEEVYTELRDRAHGQRKQWKGTPTLQTTALVHEAYLKLIDQEEQSWSSRSHFFAVASRAMRHILVDHARKHRAEKRGGKFQTLSLEDLRESLQREQAAGEERSEMIMVLDAALGQFEKEHSRAARVVECRYFGGMTIEETAEALGVSASTVSRDWDLAQSWLYREMKRIHGPAESPEGDDDW